MLFNSPVVKQNLISIIFFNMEDFRNNLKNLLFDVLEYGIKITNLEFPNGALRVEDYNKKLIKNCHIGFRKAQLFIVKEILIEQASIKQLQNNLKTYNTIRDKQKVDEAKIKIKKIEFKIKVYKKIADTIAWQLFYTQIYVARKLNAGKENAVYLSESNIQHAIEVVNELHANLPDSFALITDITSFIGIGDILFKTIEELSLIELKQGKTNQIIETIIKNAEKSRTKIDSLMNQINKDYDDKKFFKQTQRMVNQGIRMKKVSDIINKGVSIDNFIGLPSIIPEKPMEVENFTHILINLVNQLWSGKKDWKYTVVENCVLIGIYRNKFAEIGDKIIGKLIYEESGENFPVFNYVDMCLDKPLAEPFYLKAFSRDQLVAMTFGEVKIFMAINFHELIKVFQSIGIQANWLSRKKTDNISLKSKNEIFKFKNRAIECKLNDNMILHLGGGAIFRIIFSQVLPSSIAQCIMKDLLGEDEIIEKIMSASEEEYTLPNFTQKINLKVDPYF